MHFKELQSLADKYGYDPNHNLRYLKLAQLISEYKINNLLILGCGKGVLEYILPESIQCTSVDISREDIHIAVEINSGRQNRRFIQSNILDLKGLEFPAILISEVLEHVEDDGMILNKVKDLLISGGVFILTLPNRERLNNRLRKLFGMHIQYMADDHIREYTREEAVALLVNNGFKITHEENIYVSFPKERWVRSLIPVSSSLRNMPSLAFNNIGTYFVFVTRNMQVCK